MYVFAGRELASGSVWQVADQSYGLLRVFCVCPDEAEGSTLQPHEGADA